MSPAPISGSLGTAGPTPLVRCSGQISRLISRTRLSPRCSLRPKRLDKIAIALGPLCLGGSLRALGQWRGDRKPKADEQCHRLDGDRQVAFDTLELAGMPVEPSHKAASRASALSGESIDATAASITEDFETLRFAESAAISSCWPGERVMLRRVFIGSHMPGIISSPRSIAAARVKVCRRWRARIRGLHRLFVSLGIVDEVELVRRPPLGRDLLVLRQLGLSAQAAFAVIGKLVQTMNGMPRSVGKDAEPGPIVGPAPWPVRVDPEIGSAGAGREQSRKARSSIIADLLGSDRRQAGEHDDLVGRR